MRAHRQILIVCFCLLLVACRQGQSQTAKRVPDSPPNSSRPMSKPTISPDLEQIPPNVGRIVGTIVSIEKVRAVQGDLSPCARVPCQALVRVESVIGYGSAFPASFKAGDQISVRFAFTLHPTDKLFPKMEHHLPGLKVGQVFKADVTASDLMMSGSQLELIIYTYQPQ